MTSEDEVDSRLRAANDEFYAAHEAHDFERMARLWAHGPDVVCIHPGWPILRGWDVVEDSWRRIFAGPATNQFITTNVQMNKTDVVAWLTLDENLVSPGGTGTIAATNIFLKVGDDWKIVHHHGSPVATQRNEQI